MLSSVKTTLRSKALIALTALSIAAVPAAPALAWGEREQNFVAGVAAATIAGVIINDVRQKNRARQQHYHQPQPRYYEEPRHHPRPVYAPAPQPSYNSIYTTPAARAFSNYSHTERQAIQRSLARQGYYRSGIDGSFGPGTYNAVLAYARDARLTGNLQSTSAAYGIYDSLIY